MDHVRANRSYWDEVADRWVEPGERAWRATEPFWGIFGVPESEVQMLPDDMTGLDAIELGCGTGYVSAWMARRGARPVGLDNSAAQLRTARKLQREHGLVFPLVHASAEDVPLADGSFDFAISEYGAAIWCDPHRWLPEAHRLLRPGGRLVFLGTSPIALLCMPQDGALPVTERLERPYFGMHRFDWSDAVDEPGGVEFGLGFSAWFEVFRAVGFAVEDYREPRPATGGTEVQSYCTADWARRFPCEQVWKLRRV